MRGGALPAMRQAATNLGARRLWMDAGALVILVVIPLLIVAAAILGFVATRKQER